MATALSLVIKRAFDFLSALCGLVALSPLYLILAAAIRLRLGGPVLFRQVRIGHRERPFELLKFRTMVEARDAKGVPLPDECRMTALGTVLRAYSLDEIPQLWNVLKGDMSLVGPRPLLPQYLERYSAEQRRRHHAKPGITGWAQMSGRNELTWARRFELDVWYVDNWSLALDCRILWKTVLIVLRREGVSQPGQATMQEFMGNFEEGVRS